MAGVESKQGSITATGIVENIPDCDQSKVIKELQIFKETQLFVLEEK